MGHVSSNMPYLGRHGAHAEEVAELELELPFCIRQEIQRTLETTGPYP